MSDSLANELYAKALEMHTLRGQLKAQETDTYHNSPRKRVRQLKRAVKKAERQTQKAIHAIASAHGVGFYEETDTSRHLKESIVQLTERARRHAIENSFWQIVNVSVT